MRALLPGPAASGHPSAVTRRSLQEPDRSILEALPSSHLSSVNVAQALPLEGPVHHLQAGGIIEARQLLPGQLKPVHQLTDV